jgi:hypothetical protein
LSFGFNIISPSVSETLEFSSEHPIFIFGVMLEDPSLSASHYFLKISGNSSNN